MLPADSDEYILFKELPFLRARSAVADPRLTADYPAMSPEHLAVIHNYTCKGYHHINDGLRAGSEDEFLKANVRCLESAIAQLPVFEGTVYRGTALPDTILKDYNNLYKAELPFPELPFVSASQNLSVAFRFANAAATGKNQRCIFIIEAKTPRILGNISNWGPYFRNDFEAEVLFPPGTRFLIRKMEKQQINGIAYQVIYYEEIGSPMS